MGSGLNLMTISLFHSRRKTSLNCLEEVHTSACIRLVLFQCTFYTSSSSSLAFGVL
ncbi:hypothetical protein V6Z12_D10G067200 [Gossypium hirsutum]